MISAFPMALHVLDHGNHRDATVGRKLGLLVASPSDGLRKVV
jgi:hypothetical protein